MTEKVEEQCMDHKQSLEFKYELFCSCRKKSLFLLKKALEFARSHGREKYHQYTMFKEVVVAGARYMHRGYYCPSLIRELMIDNVCRGRILKHPTVRSKISHRYFFDEHGYLRIAKAKLPNLKEKTEYILYEENTVYGFAFDDWGTLVALSEERYVDGVLTQYLVASCYINPEDGTGRELTHMLYEEYGDIADGHATVQCYEMHPDIAGLELQDMWDAMVHGTKYSCSYEEITPRGLKGLRINREF